MQRLFVHALVFLVTLSTWSRSAALAQQGSTVSGTVRSAEGTPLAGARVTILGTRLSRTTDQDGRYSVDGVPAGAHRLRATLIGYAPADLAVTVVMGQAAVADLRLEAQPVLLDPVVAIGYATVERRDLTGAVASVVGEDVLPEAAPVSAVSNALQGKAAGVQVVVNSGIPGAGASVRVRGTGSISANSEPLYVVDGVPAVQGTGSQDPSYNPLNEISPTDIESVEVLKDASAAAIYGARGANGVVLIQTRRGRTGEDRVTVESSYGVQEATKRIPVLSGPEFMTLVNEAYLNAGRAARYTPQQIANAPTYHYPDLMLRTAYQQNHSITLTGGDGKTRYLLSGNYLNHNGIVVNTGFERFGARLNVDRAASDRFRLGTSASLTRVAQTLNDTENGGIGAGANGMLAAMNFDPTLPPKNDRGEWNQRAIMGEQLENPLANTMEKVIERNEWRLLGSVFAELDLFRDVRLRSSLGANAHFWQNPYFAPRTVSDGADNNGEASLGSGQERELTSETTANLRRTLGSGNLEVLGGFSVQTFAGENVRAEAAIFPTDQTTTYNLGSGSQLIPPGSGIGKSAILSYLARANYNIGGKYLFTLTGRYDGSSRFGANNKWAFFPSGAVAWRMTDERFMQDQSLLSDLKLRLSYGRVGSQAVESYQSLTQLNTAWYTAGGIEIPALAPAGRKPNPDLRWEQQTQFNVGVDAAFLDNRLTVTLDHYRSTTKDLLLVIPLPSTTGFTSQLRNIGSMRNRGIELSVGSVNVQRDRLTWRSAFNVTANRNKVLNLGVDSALFLAPRTGNFFAPNDIYVVKVGQPLGAIFGYAVTGLWQSGDQCYLRNPTSNCVPGEYKIVDSDGDSTITAADRIVLGYGDPKFYGGLSNSLAYGRFSLDVFLSFVSGNKVVNAGKAYGCAAIGQANERTCVRDRWTPTDTLTDVPRANRSRPRRLYSTFVEDGSYLRLQTLTVGYQLPSRWLRGVEAAQLYLTGQNLWTVTGYSGFDPDVNSMGGDARFGGIDIGAYPRTRTWNLGLSLTF